MKKQNTSPNPMREIKILEPEKLWFTSDTHFWHQNIISWTGRPWKDAPEMNKALIENWNSVVPKDGLVFHLGDFCFAGASEWGKLRRELNGRIYLVMGNHDSVASQPMLELFEKVYGGIARLRVGHQEIWASHFPLMCWTGMNRESWNLYGHVHTMKVPDSQQLGLDAPRVRDCSVPGKQYDVGVDYNDYKPISFFEIQRILKDYDHK